METLVAVPEQHLVKEVLHSCQGISGRYIFLHGGSDASSGFACQPGAEIPITQQQLIGKVTELGCVGAQPLPLAGGLFRSLTLLWRPYVPV
jgi:hypothetical protein